MNPEATAPELRWNHYATVLPSRRTTYVLLEDRGQILRVPHAEHRAEELDALAAAKLDGLGSLRETLAEVGALVPRDHDERAAVMALARASETAADRGTTKMHLFLTHACNFRCSYCIQGYAIKREQPGFMDRERVDAAFDSLAPLVEAIPSGRMPRAVTLFGGEPMMPATKTPLLHAIDRAVELGLALTAVTNGYYYELFREALGERGVRDRMTYLVSLDGPPQIHNVRRSLINGKGSFAEVADNVTRMLDDGARVDLQPIVDEQNADALEDLHAIARQRGWTASERFQIRCGITMYPNAEAFPGRRGSHEQQVLAKVLSFSERHERVSAGFDAVLKRSHFLDKVLRERKPIPVNTGCDAKRAGALSFSPDGLVYPCREYAGHGEARAIARYFPGLELVEHNFRSWFDWRVSTHPKCSSCKHMLLCGGGCRVESETQGRDERVDPLCPDYQTIWRSYLEYLEADA